MACFALIHSPLVGPLTWKLVAQQLKEAGHTVILPTLMDNGSSPFCLQHADSAAKAISQNGTDTCILVGHSGAGPLLPLIGAEMNIPVSAYIFVDAGLPQPNTSRLEMLKNEIPAQAEDFETFLKNGGCYPQWQDADLHPLLPDLLLRRQMLAELNSRDLSFFTEIIPPSPGWETNLCGYIQLSSGYTVPADHARQKGWPVFEFQAGHFHLLVEPQVVANALVQMASQLLHNRA
ncbi:MAG: alpha/beta fold hydrolase [Anaerolineales bacterium]|nr:alpha/beta fold hydrolase [Anaerolineales bacterium]